MIFMFLIPTAAIWIFGALLSILHVRRALVAVEDEAGFRVLDQPREKSARAFAVLGTD